MKFATLALWSLAPLMLAAGEVQPGDNFDQVCAILGTPRGQMSVNGRRVLYFERGEVELRAGAVTRVALLSDEVHAAREARRAAEAERRRTEQEIRRARTSAEGEELKARMLADVTFQTAAPGEQLASWENFARRYPEVSVGEQLTAARLRLAGQAEARRAREIQGERIAELEARLAAAEARADTARAYRYVSFYGGRHSPRQASNLWPIEYHFNGDSQQPYAATISYPAWGSTPYDRRRNLQADDSPDNEPWNRRRAAPHSDRGFRDWSRRHRF